MNRASIPTAASLLVVAAIAIAIPPRAQAMSREPHGRPSLAQTDDRPWKVELGREADRASVDQADEGKTVVVHIDSATGTGTATVTRTQPDTTPWPDRLELRLPLKALEGLTIQAGDVTLSAFVSKESAAEVHVGQRLADGSEEVLATDSPIRPVITRKAIAGSSDTEFHIVLPAALTQKAGRGGVKVDWVDFYR